LYISPEAFGHLNEFIQPVSFALLRELYGAAQEWKYTCVSLQQVNDIIPEPVMFPFGQIKFVSPKQPAPPKPTPVDEKRL